jgi:hypothetical protein
MWHRNGMVPRSLVVIALCACGDRSEAPVRTSPAAVIADAGVQAPLVTAPHTGPIATVAVADHADAAITADETGELRFWPALDGTREPVVIRGRAASDLALARDHDGHLAAVLDAAGGLELLHIAATGALRSRQIVPADPRFEELAAGTTALLARRTDHTVVRLDVKSAPLAPQASEQILAIAARRSTVVAGIGDRERPAEIRFIREIRLAGALAWGREHELPVPLAPPIAVSPSGKRIAGLHARTGAGVVIELVPKPRVLATEIVGTDLVENTIGFLDDEHAAFRGGVLVTVAEVDTDADPWNATRSMVRARIGRSPVVADGAVVSGQGTSLVIANGERAQFLGYRDLGAGFLRVTGEQISLSLGNRILWLDDKLQLRRAIDVVNDAAGGLPVDDTHVLKATYSYLEDNRSALAISLAGDKEVPLGSWPLGSTVAYDPRSQVFSISAYTGVIARNRLDVANGKSTPLRGIKARPDSVVELVDPAQADGVVAVSYAFGDRGMYIDTYVDDGKSTRAMTPAATIKVRDAVLPVGVDQRGTMYTLAARPENEAKPILAHQAGKAVRRVMVDGSVNAAVVDRTGSLIAGYSRQSVILYDMDGKERWRAPAWSVNMARFTADGKTLLVNTNGGLLALDLQTGERRATGCGWGFGLSTIEPQLTVFSAPVVCAEAP